jgi:D-sedoheptulose 7-phosphate isomerase
VTQDPRFKNDYPRGATVDSYLSEYARTLLRAVGEVEAESLSRAYGAIEKCLKNGARVYVAGNGGSATIADHLCCDWMKDSYVEGKSNLRVHSLISNTALFTALANDFGYENSFARQVEYLGDAGDVLVLVSSSGNSPNIIEALEAGRRKQMTVIGVSGFTGGKLKELADISVHVPVKNYGMCEDAHQMIMHCIAQFLTRQRDPRL